MQAYQGIARIVIFRLEGECHAPKPRALPSELHPETEMETENQRSNPEGGCTCREIGEAGTGRFASRAEECSPALMYSRFYSFPLYQNVRKKSIGNSLAY